ncbi:MAG: 4-hydroxy-tetrahydrodipicolinate synthase, partial [Bacteroidia bacterium]
MSIYTQLKGTGVAIVTPFTKTGAVDFAGLSKLVNHLIKGKVEYLVVLGTTGETATLTKDEKQQVINHVIKETKKRVPLVIGIGGNNTQEVVDTIKHADLSAFAAILSVSPYYNKPSQQGIYQHYKAIALSTTKPIILYNVPGRTMSNITADTTLKLAHDFKNIIGIKEASGNLEQCMSIIKNRPKNFLVISGDDNLTLPLLACG